MKSLQLLLCACALTAAPLALAQTDPAGATPDAGVAAPDTQPVLTAEETHVTAEALSVERIAGSAASVSEKELDRFEYQDIHRVLEKVPGVYLRGEDGYGLRPNIGLRGANSDRSSKVALMEDGIPLAPAPYSAPAAYYFPAMNRLVGVDVYKGPAAIRFGPQTVGGAVNVRTRDIPQQGLSGLVDLAAGLNWFGRAHGAVGYGSERFGVLLEGVHTQTTGFKQLDTGGNTGFDKNEAMLKARYTLPAPEGAQQSLQLKLGLANEESDETYLGLSDADFLASPYRRYAASQLDHMSWLRSQAQLAWNLKLGAPFEVTVTAYRHDFARAWRKLNRFQPMPGTDAPAADLVGVLTNPTGGLNGLYAAILRGEEDSAGPGEGLMVGTNDRRFVSQGVNADGTLMGTLGLEHLVRFGVRAHYDRVERLQTEDPYDMRGGSLVRQEGAPQLLRDDNRGSTYALSAYAVDELYFDRLMLTPGVRVELVSTRFVNRDAPQTPAVEAFHPVVLPGIGALYQLSDALSVFGGVHRGFSPPTPQPTLASPEYSVNYEAGSRYQDGTSQAELIGFFNDYSNLTRTCTSSTGCSEELLDQQFDGGRVHVYGLEAVAGHELALWGATRLRLSGTYTLTLSRFLTSFASENPQFGEVREGDALPYVPQHQAAVGGMLLGERWTLALTGTLVGEMRERAGAGAIPEHVRIPAYTVVDVAAGWKPTQSGEVYATVENVLNSPYLSARRPFGARPGRPLFLQVGYKHHF